MTKVFLLISILVMAVVPLARAQSECDEPAAAFDNWFAAARDDLLATEEHTLVDNPDWAEIYENFADYVLHFAEECPSPDDNFSYTGEFRSGDDLFFGYDVLPSVTPIDINLDGADDWLVSLRVGSRRYGGGQAIVDALYWNDDAWTMTRIWPLESHEEAMRLEYFPQLIYLHEQADTQNRSYMGLFFDPGIGPDLYVGGLAVIRWDEWQPQEILFIEQACVFGDWERGEDRGLYIPTSSIVPWQGCTYPRGALVDGIQIPGARMSIIEEE